MQYPTTSHNRILERMRKGKKLVYMCSNSSLGYFLCDEVDSRMITKVDQKAAQGLVDDGLVRKTTKMDDLTWVLNVWEIEEGM